MMGRNKITAIIFNSLIACATLLSISCAKGPGKYDRIKLSEDKLVFTAKGGTKVITSNQVICFDTIYYFDEKGNKQIGIRNELYDIKTDDSIEYEWIKVSKNGTKDSHYLVFEAQPNTSGVNRKLTVLIVRDSFDVTKEILVQQTAK